MGMTREAALAALASNDLIGLGMEADALRRQLHPEGVVTYLIDRRIDCPATLDREAIFNQIRDTLSLGGTGIHLRGLYHPARTLDDCEQLLSSIRTLYPRLWLQSLSAPEILALARSVPLDLDTTIARLRDSGLDSISWEGLLPAENASAPAGPGCTPGEWLAVHRAAHRAGMRTVAALHFGGGESHSQRVSQLEQISSLQQETAGFTAFLPLSAAATAASDETTAVEYLKVLAVSRLYLDNIANIQSSWTTQGLKVLQMSLRFGGNDAGSVLLEQNRTRTPGVSNAITEEELRHIIRDAGFKPVQRDNPYRTLFLN